MYAASQNVGILLLPHFVTLLRALSLISHQHHHLTRPCKHKRYKNNHQEKISSYCTDFPNHPTISLRPRLQAKLYVSLFTFQSPSKSMFWWAGSDAKTNSGYLLILTCFPGVPSFVFVSFYKICSNLSISVYWGGLVQTYCKAKRLLHAPTSLLNCIITSLLPLYEDNDGDR